MRGKIGNLGRFDEAFLNNSEMDIMPPVKVRDSAGKSTNIGSGEPGGLTRRPMAACRETVRGETVW